MVMMIACGMVMHRGSTVCCGSDVDAGTDRHHSRLTSTKAASYTTHTVAAGALSVCITRMMMCCMMGSMMVILVEQSTGELIIPPIILLIPLARTAHPVGIPLLEHSSSYHPHPYS